MAQWSGEAGGLNANPKQRVITSYRSSNVKVLAGLAADPWAFQASLLLRTAILVRTSTSWQLGQDAAERYERILVPTILGPFARVLAEHSSAASLPISGRTAPRTSPCKVRYTCHFGHAS